MPDGTAGVALITGITGQDGGYLAEQLVSEGLAVHGVVRAGDPARDELLARTPSVTLHVGDLADAAGVTSIVSDVAPNEIYNLGGLSSVAQSWEQPLVAATSIGLGAASVLEAGWVLQQRTSRIVRVVQASSAEIFGIPEESPQNEATRLRPSSPYGAAKAYAHNLVSVYRTRGLHAVSAILYNHESPRRPSHFVTRKISQSVARIARGQLDMMSLGNLDSRRDWGWAPEYVEALVLSARYSEPHDYIIATGVSHSIRDFVAAAFRCVGISDWSKYVSVDANFVRRIDAADLVGDPTLARSMLGWSPGTSFEELVQLMVDHDLEEAAES